MGMAFWLYQFLLFFVLVFSCDSHSHATALLTNSVSSQQPSHSYMCPDHERSALLEFKQSFLIDCSTSDDPSAYPKVKSWGGKPIDGNCCFWDGVTCSKESGHVVGLDLSSGCLYGTLPPNSTLFTLTRLQHLDLSHNNFKYSHIPSELGHLSNLRTLSLSESALIGQVPYEISKLSKLSFLDLSFNAYFPTNYNIYSKLKLEYACLEKLLQNLTRLKVLHLDAVDISSPTPIILTNLTSLEDISLEGCNLYGQFPSSVFQLPCLESLNLIGNVNLVGSLPEFQHNSSIGNLRLSLTAFHGGLPSSIGKLAGFETLLLDHCQLSGLIPSSLGNLTSLIRLDLSHNDFSDDFPSSLTNLTQLQILGLSNLKITSKKLISWLVKLNKLTRLILPGMNIGGEMPSFLANLTGLIWLDLSHNQITGQIPNWLLNLTQLQFLRLEYNQLKGQIPSEGISQLADLATLTLDGNENLYGNFDGFLKLKNLISLGLSGVKVTFLSKNVDNVSVPKFALLFLDSCELTEFPQFLRNQDALVELSLRGNNIRGLIPHWFVNVAVGCLQILDLSHNFFTAFEQPVAFLPWSHLQALNLEGNELQGSLPIPPTSIEKYQVSNNHFVGEIPHQICRARSLKSFDISFNNFSGQIPSCIGKLGGSLAWLNLKGNKLSGTILHAFGKSCELQMIDLSQNQLEGRMPRSLANCNNLEVLDIGENHINDTFPSWLGSLPNLHILILRQNNFHGKIGRLKVGHDFHSLRIIDLSKNFHIGDLPVEYLQNWDAMKIIDEKPLGTSGTSCTLDATVLNVIQPLPEQYNYSITITNKGHDMVYTKILTVFRVIDFSSNNFTGKIPYVIGELRGLQVLNLSNNNLHGGMPLSLANMTDLESLDLSNNMLSGEIPHELTQLTSLEVFNISHNLLVGAIPQGRQFGAFDESSFVGNLGLCGLPLPKKCGIAEEQPPPSADVNSNDEEGDSDHMIDWIIRCLGCVSGFVVGCALGKFLTDRHHGWFVETFGRRRKPQRKVR